MLLSQITSQVKKNWRDVPNEVRKAKNWWLWHKCSTVVTSRKAQCKRALEAWKGLPWDLTMCRFSLQKGLPRKVLTGEDTGGKSLSNRIENWVSHWCSLGQWNTLNWGFQVVNLERDVFSTDTYCLERLALELSKVLAKATGYDEEWRHLQSLNTGELWHEDGQCGLSLDRFFTVEIPKVTWATLLNSDHRFCVFRA